MDKIEFEEWMLKGVHEGRGVEVLEKGKEGGRKQEMIEVSASASERALASSRIHEPGGQTSTGKTMSGCEVNPSRVPCCCAGTGAYIPPRHL